jgi:Ca2+/Na+ antiporter
MIKKNIESITCLFDLLIIFSPFILLFDGGYEKFVYLFYLIYLPSLVFSVYKKRMEVKAPKQQPKQKKEKKELVFH